MIEERKTLCGYLTQVFTLYGITISIFILFGLLTGEYAKEVSSLFALGGQGLRFSTMLQLLGMSVFITLFRVLFFTDILFRNMAIVIRTVGMLTGVYIDFTTIWWKVVCFLNFLKFFCFASLLG